MTDDLTTLVCLFHHPDQAKDVLGDLTRAGVPQSTISLIDESGSTTSQYSGSSLDELRVPARDQKHLLEGVRNGGVIVAVSAISEHVATVERIFSDHRASKIDEEVIGNEGYDEGYVAPAAALSTATVAGETVIPVVEEELVVGKRTVDQGGVRVYRRIVEIPVEESVRLREEHVTVDRIPVDRAATSADLAGAGTHVIELTETAEEAVVGKTAQVVEEIHVGKVASEHTEHIRDTVRQTEVEIEEVGTDALKRREL